MNSTPNLNLTVNNTTNQISTGIQILVNLVAIAITSVAVFSYCIYVKIVYTDKNLMKISFFRISIFSACSDMLQMILISALIVLLTVFKVKTLNFIFYTKNMGEYVMFTPGY